MSIQLYMNNNLSNDNTLNKFNRIIINKQRMRNIPYPLFNQKQEIAMPINKRKISSEKFYVLSLNRVTQKNINANNRNSFNSQAINQQGQTRKKSISLLPVIQVEATVVNGPKCQCERQKLQSGWVNPCSKQQISQTKKKQLSSYLNYRKIYNLQYPKFMQNERSISTNKQRNGSPLGDILDRYHRKRYPSLPNITVFPNENKISKKHNKQIAKQFQFTYQFFKKQTIYSKQIHSPKLSKSKNIQISLKYHKIPIIPLKNNIEQFIENYQCISNQINLNNIIQQTNFMVEYQPTQIYFGQMENKVKAGNGVLITNYSCFQGMFKNNQKVRGTEIQSKGIYKGQFYNNRREGAGQFQYINGEYYVGDWKHDYRHGNGTWTSRQGDSYTGEWANDKMEGFGIYTRSCRQYKGNFVNGKKEGWGKQSFQNGDCFEGLFKNGVPEGQGSYIWSNKTRYEGQFHLGFRNGKGYMSTAQGWTYKGDFTEERAQGQCQIVSNVGDVYKGGIRNGKRNGRGELMMVTGDRILAFWQDDIILNMLQV